ncbi:hypothetical protein ACUJ8H_07565 [Streptomyces sp. EKR5.2]|uniref:hypothetical protein n=1 Tax=Streptomyces sp. EKR5.2 TaxID=3461014 RepID=UPI0040431424
MTTPGSTTAASGSPAQLLASADRLLSATTISTTGVWPRAAALLLRHALEEALRSYWQRVRPQLARVPTHAQVLCLESYAGAEAARRWSSVWSNLSQACHYHGYELSPVPAELRDWREEVAAVISLLPS